MQESVTVAVLTNLSADRGVNHRIFEIPNQVINKSLNGEIKIGLCGIAKNMYYIKNKKVSLVFYCSSD
jgi:hypothetical protein